MKHKSTFLNNKNIIFLLLLFTLLLSINVSYADNTYIGTNLTMIDNGTVSGGLYSDSYYGYAGSTVNHEYTVETNTSNSTNQNSNNITNTTYGTSDVKLNDTDLVYRFKALPENITVKSAHIVAGIYMGNMRSDYPVTVYMDLNNNLLLNNTLSSTYSANNGTTIINDNITRVTGDYLIHYDVTNFVKDNDNKITLKLSNSQFATIKIVTLLVAYDDGDSDTYNYIINLGHDVANEDSYVGSTKFSGINTGNKVDDANLTVYYLASSNGAYRFNNEILESSSPQASYSGISSWNVTDYYTKGTSNILEYHKNYAASFYKIIMSTMLVKYHKLQEISDLYVNEIYINPNYATYKNNLYVDESNNIIVTISNIGAKEAKNFNVTLNIGNTTLKKRITSINPDEKVNVSFTNDLNLSIGTTIVKAYVDIENTLTEINKSNNNKSLNVSVIKINVPDLSLDSIRYSDNITINKTNTITISVSNKGLIQSNTSKIYVYNEYDNVKTLIYSTNIGNLNVNSTQNISFNWTPRNYGAFNLIATINQSGYENNYTNNMITTSIIVKNPNKTLIFIISDNAGVNSYNEATKLIIKKYYELVDIQIRTTSQIENMSSSMLKSYLSNCDIFIGDWISTIAYEKINGILKNNTNIPTNKLNKIFLILEPPVSSIASSATLIKYSSFNINGIDKIKSIKDINESTCSEYYYNTTRGNSYENVYKYVNNQKEVPTLFNKAVLYKDIVNVNAYENLVLWLLNELDSGTFTASYSNVPSTLNTPSYGIYRDKWYSYIDNSGIWHSGIENYMNEHFKNGQATVGLIESKMYVESQQLQTYTEIITQLEELGLNVIPIVAYGGSSEQLDVMLKTFTNATNLSSFLDNPNKYNIRIDTLINMVAYGLGGLDFSNVTPFFTALNVPILKSIHSDYISNNEYDLGSTGLGAISGDKWWHITISESQGTITPTFVGGYDYTIDNTTGASISGYVPHINNIKVLTTSVYNWILLKTLSNSEKKISIIYYNYPPGKQNIAASYLDPVESILNLLNILKDNGYDVKNIPSNSTILLAQMLSQGTNVANWAHGLVETMASNNENSLQEIQAYQENNTYKIDFSNMTEEEIRALEDTPGALLYPVEEFRKWYDKLDNLTKVSISEGPISYIGELSRKAVKLKYNLTSVIEEWYNGIIDLVPVNKANVIDPLILKIKNVLINYVETRNESFYKEYLSYKTTFLSYNIEGLSGWGEFPGNIMIVERNNTKYFLLPGIQYGNVFIAPEPQRGWEGNAEQLYHNTVVPPHYQYLALFAYIQEKGYNAMVFVGRHATHEWMSGKEVLCAYNDFTTILTGSIPQVYFYITDGISEALTAKRRGSAVIINHLTPPMSFTSLYGNLSTLQHLASEYEEADNDDEKLEIINELITVIKENNYESDMGIKISQLTDEELVDAVNDYLESMSSTMYPYGVHVLGQDWVDDEIALLVSSMLSVEFEYNNAGDTTTFLNELSLIYKNKSYKQLSASGQYEIQEKSFEILLRLMNNTKKEVINQLTSNPSEGLIKSIDLAIEYINNIKKSTENEISSFLNALNAGYIVPGTGDDPINNPSSLPTGRNSYQDQSTEVPTPSAYAKSEELTKILLTGINETTRKIVMGIWDTETARDDGEFIAVVLRLLGLKPVWTNSPSAGTSGKKLKETPEYLELDDLTRLDNWTKKRIDVVIVLDGNFRDLYSRQVGLLDKAFRIALARSYYTIINNKTLIEKYGSNLTLALNTIMESIGYYGLGNESLDDNAIAYDWVDDFIYYMGKNINPIQAGEYAINRIFAPPENDYGALISQAVRQSWTFNDTEELAMKYLKRMSYIYSSNSWGSYNTDVFAKQILGATILFTSRNTNLYGIIDNDDYFDYWGGLYNLMFYINNEYISFNIIKYGSGNDSTIFSLDKYLNRELNSRYYNPSWIKSMMNESYSGAGYISKFMSNLYGWQWTAQNEVKNWMWDKVVRVYIDDEYGIGITDFLSDGYNAYALISLTGTLLTTAYDGFWETDDATLRKIANLYAKTVIENGVACCDCSCGNIAMMDWTLKFINADLLSSFKQRLFQATENKLFLDDGLSEDPNSNGSDPTQNGTGTNTTGGSTNINGTGSDMGNSSIISNNTSDHNSNNSGNSTQNSNQNTNSTIPNQNTENHDINENQQTNIDNTKNTTTQTDTTNINESTMNTSKTNSTNPINQANSSVEDNLNNNDNKKEDEEINEQNNDEVSNVGNDESSKSDTTESSNDLVINPSNTEYVEVEVTSVIEDSSLSKGKLYELSEAKKGSAITDTGMSFIAVLFVCAILGVISYGYYKKSRS